MKDAVSISQKITVAFTLVCLLVMSFLFLGRSLTQLGNYQGSATSSTPANVDLSQRFQSNGLYLPGVGNCVVITDLKAHQQYLGVPKIGLVRLDTFSEDLPK